MKSVKESMKKDLKRFGIESSKNEECPICKYGRRITVTVNGIETSHCKYCDDKKLVQELNIATTESEKRLQTLQSKAKYFSRIPEDLKDVKLNDYVTESDEQTRAKQMAIGFITGFDKEKSFVMSGDPGIGKSHIAVAIAKALSNDYSVLFLKSADILGLIRDSYNGSRHTEQDVFDICQQVDLLVLDDIGAEYDKSSSDDESWASDILFRILDSRLGKSTVATTNYSESQLENKFGMNGKRIVSRMQDTAEKIRIQGNDWRKK